MDAPPLSPIVGDRVGYADRDNPVPPRGTTDQTHRFNGVAETICAPCMLPRLIIRAELAVRGPHWKSRARLATGCGWRVLKNRPFRREERTDGAGGDGDVPGD